MAAASLPNLASMSTSLLLPSRTLIPHQIRHSSLPLHPNETCRTHRKKPTPFKVQAAKLPVGVELPKMQPKFEPPFLGFTRTAEIWNSRACMIGLIGTFVVELILNKGILEMIGVEIGKGLDLPL